MAEDSRRKLRALYNRIVLRFGGQVQDYLSGRMALIGTPAEWTRELQRAFARHLTRLLLDVLYVEALRARRNALALLPLQLAVDEATLLDDALRHYLAAHVGQIWRNLARDLAEAITTRIQQGLIQGETTQTLLDAVGQLMGESVAEYRLERIVRTETTRAYNAALVYDTAPYDEVVAYRYAVVLDPRTSTVCKPLAGKIVRKESLRYIPPLHPNCRTVLVPLLAGDLPADDTAYLDDSDIDDTAQRFGALPDFLRDRLLGAGTPRVDFWREWLAHEPLIYRFCLQVTRGREDDARDLLHDTMLRCYDHYHLYDPNRSQFSTWVYRILQNLHATQCQRNARFVPLVDPNQKREPAL